MDNKKNISPVGEPQPTESIKIEAIEEIDNTITEIKRTYEEIDELTAMFEKINRITKTVPCFASHIVFATNDILNRIGKTAENGLFPTDKLKNILKTTKNIQPEMTFEVTNQLYDLKKYIGDAKEFTRILTRECKRTIETIETIDRLFEKIRDNYEAFKDVFKMLDWEIREITDWGLNIAEKIKDFNKIITKRGD